MNERLIESRDLFLYQFPSELACSPSGDYLAFVLSHMDEAGDCYRSDLWLMQLRDEKAEGNGSGHLSAFDESLRRLTASGDVKSFYWEDETHLVFPSARNNPAPGTTEFFRLSLNGGEAEKAFVIPEVVGCPVILPDGKMLFKIKRVTDKAEAQPDHAQEGKDFWTFTDKPFIRDGERFGQRRRMMLAIYDEKISSLEKITPKFFEVGGFSLSPDRKKILYFGEEYENCNSLYQSLQEYNIETGETRCLIGPGRYQISIAEYCEAGIFLQASTLERTATQNHALYLLDPESGKMNLLAEPDGMFSSLIDIDVTYGAGKKNRVSGNTFIGARIAAVKTEFDAVDMTSGKLRQIAKVDAYTCMDLCGDSLYAVALNDYELSEIWKISLTDGTQQKLTDFGGQYLHAHQVSKPEALSFISSNGEKVDGFVLKPAEFDETKQYPGVLMIHGGPKWAYSASFMHQMQVLCAKGMFVFFCNPHGGDGYGDQFLEMVKEWGKYDYLHCMEFTDACLAKYPQLDRERLGVTGGSYGGYMTNWIIGHTDRFKAAVSQRGICNMITECLVVDIGERLMKQAGGDCTPWEGEEVLWEMSPLKYVKNVKTPTLFIHSDMDYRCFSGEAMQMFTAMKQLGVKTELLLFHGDSHGLSRSGRPSHRVVRVDAITNWFMENL